MKSGLLFKPTSGGDLSLLNDISVDLRSMEAIPQPFEGKALRQFL
jgi:hypothetical protein